jgi:hypothetical protein
VACQKVFNRRVNREREAWPEIIDQAGFDKRLQPRYGGTGGRPANAPKSRFERIFNGKAAILAASYDEPCVACASVARPRAPVTLMTI